MPPLKSRCASSLSAAAISCAAILSAGLATPRLLSTALLAAGAGVLLDAHAQPGYRVCGAAGRLLKNGESAAYVAKFLKTDLFGGNTPCDDRIREAKQHLVRDGAVHEFRGADCESVNAAMQIPRKGQDVCSGMPLYDVLGNDPNPMYRFNPGGGRSRA